MFTGTISMIICLFLSQILSLPINQSKNLQKISFGSCYGLFGAKSDIFKAISEYKPDIWIWLGDAAYVDQPIAPHYFIPSKREIVNKTFKETKNNFYYKKLAENTQISGIWDDHDYNLNNGDSNNPTKDWAQIEYLDFLDEPQDSIRRKRKGVYISYEFGKEIGKKIKIILLDVRYFKIDGGDILGNEQWEWLKNELKFNNSAKFTIIASGTQILPTNRIITENWSIYNKKRLLNTISESNCPGLILF